ncbi:hypothetical protein D3C76_1814300 [compost metagenome]
MAQLVEHALLNALAFIFQRLLTGDQFEKAGTEKVFLLQRLRFTARALIHGFLRLQVQRLGAAG